MGFSVRNSLSILAGVTTAVLVVAAPGAGVVAEPGVPFQVAPALITPALIGDPAIAADPMLLLDDSVTFSDDTASKAPRMNSASLDPELECMAKVVRHEAANQSRQGQRAVAEILMNRAQSGRFPSTICGVANQPGQFFNTASYNPSRDTPQWRTAVEVSRAVISGEGPSVAPGAYFYHAAYQAPTRFFRTRTQILAMGDHVFYR